MGQAGDHLEEHVTTTNKSRVPAGPAPGSVKQRIQKHDPAQVLTPFGGGGGVGGGRTMVTVGKPLARARGAGKAMNTTAANTIHARHLLFRMHTIPLPPCSVPSRFPRARFYTAYHTPLVAGMQAFPVVLFFPSRSLCRPRPQGSPLTGRKTCPRTSSATPCCRDASLSNPSSVATVQASAVQPVSRAGYPRLRVPVAAIAPACTPDRSSVLPAAHGCHEAGTGRDAAGPRTGCGTSPEADRAPAGTGTSGSLA